MILSNAVICNCGVLLFYSSYHGTMKLSVEVLYNTKFWQGKTLVNLAKQMPFANILATQPNSRFTKIANIGCCKFANIFLIKTPKRSIRQSFIPPNFALYAMFV